MTCNNVDYQFTKVPTKLFMCLDCNCRSVLFTLIQLSMLADEQGWFFRSNADLEAETKLSRKVIDGVLDALLRKGLIDFIPQQQGQGVKQTSRLYYVNFNSFLEYEKISIDDCIKNPKYQILTSDYKNGTFAWKGKEWANKRASLSLTSTLPISPSSPPVSPQLQPKVPTSIDTIDNKENINIKNNKLLNINSLNNSIISIENNSAEHSTRSSETIERPSSSFVDGLELSDETEIRNNYKHSKTFLSEVSRNRMMDELLEYANSHQSQILNTNLDELNEAAKLILSSKKDFMMLCLKQVDTRGKMEKVAREYIYKAIIEQGIDNDYDFEQTFHNLYQYYIKHRDNEQEA